VFFICIHIKVLFDILYPIGHDVQFCAYMYLGPTQSPIQWVPGVLSLELKRPARETDHSPPYSAEFKIAWSYTSILPIRLRGVVLR